MRRPEELGLAGLSTNPVEREVPRRPVHYQRFSTPMHYETVGKPVVVWGSSARCEHQSGRYRSRKVCFRRLVEGLKGNTQCSSFKHCCPRSIRMLELLMLSLQRRVMRGEEGEKRASRINLNRATLVSYVTQKSCGLQDHSPTTSQSTLLELIRVLEHQRSPREWRRYTRPFGQTHIYSCDCLRKC